MSDLNLIMAITALLALVGVTSSKLSSRLGVPVLLIFLAVGMLAGSEGPGGIDFDDAEIAQSLGIVALAYILFAGGLDTKWSDVRPVLAQGVALAMVGTLITAAITGLVATWVLDVSLETGLLLGAIVSSTDAAAVFAILRSRSVSLQGRLKPLLELESGSNDPMAVFLTVAMLELVTNSVDNPVELIPMFATQMALGTLAGVGFGRAGAALMNRLRLDYDGLYPVFSLAWVAATYSVTALLGGSGFIAVYVAGLVMARQAFLHKNSIVRFHDGIAWVAQIAMFTVLGLLVTPSMLGEVAIQSLVVAASLIVLARPVAVFLTLLPFRMPGREVALTSWVGLRGAAPIILATFPLMEGVPDDSLIFHVVFFIVLTSVLIQGTTIPLAAQLLGVSSPMEARRAWPLEANTSTLLAPELHEVMVPAESNGTGRTLVELGLPSGTMIVLIDRDGQFTVPTGATELIAHDRLLVIGPDEGVDALRALLVPFQEPGELGP